MFSRLIVSLLLLFSLPLLAQDAKFEFADLAKNIEGGYERGIRAKLRTLKERNISIYAANCPASVATSFILSDGAERVKTYDMVFYIGVNQLDGNKWDYSYRINANKTNSALFQAAAQAFQNRFKQHCPDGKKMSGQQARKIWLETFEDILATEAQLRATVTTGQLTHRQRVSPYLPVVDQLENQIIQFGQLVRNEVSKWEQARIIHTAADKVGDMTYSVYLNKALAFGASLKKLLNDFHRDVTSSSTFKGLYTAGIDQGLVTQGVHFRQIGNYTGNPMYFERAHKILKRELKRGKTEAALKEFAALENTIAYHELYDLYVWLDHEDWLAIPRTTYKAGTKWKQKATNNYKFNTLLDEEGELGSVGIKAKFGGIDVGFDLLSANHKRELFLVAYDSDILPLKYKLYVACASLNAKATLNAHADFDVLENVPSGNVLPQGNNVNTANRSHIFHYPANFFAGTTSYSYTGASTGGTAANVTVEQVLAGDMTFENAGRSFKIGTDGTNLALHAQPGAEVTVLASTIGTGFCYGTGIHAMTGVPATLTDAPLRAIPDDTVSVKRALLSFMRKDQPELGSKAKEILDGIINDAKIIHQTFGKGATIKIHPLSSGFWGSSGSPYTFSGNASKLNGNDAVTLQNAKAVNHVYPQVKSYLETALANAGIPITNFKITAATPNYLAPAAFGDKVDELMQHNYELEHEPKGWRLVLVSIEAPL